MARLRPDAFTKGPRTGKTPVRGNISPACIQIQLILARYACYVSEKPRKAPLGNTPREHLAAKGRFRRPTPSNRARRTNPCHPPVAPPLRRGSCPSSCIAGSSSSRLTPAQRCLPPAPRQYPPPANACRLPCPLQSETSRRWTSVAIIRRMACSSGKPRGAVDCVISTGRPTTGCCAELGLNSKAVNKWAQNRRRSPQARPVLRQRCRKRPSKGRIPLDGTIGTPKKATKVVFLGCPWPSLRQSFSRLCRSVSQHRCRVGLSWAALVQFVPGSFEIY